MTDVIKGEAHPAVLYRYETSVKDDIVSSSLHTLAVFADVVRYAFEVVRVTPRGYWIRTSPGGPKLKWVSAHTTKRYAHADDREALTALAHRKIAYHRHARRKLAEARQAMDTASLLLTNPNNTGVRVIKIGCDGWGE